MDPDLLHRVEDARLLVNADDPKELCTAGCIRHRSDPPSRFLMRHELTLELNKIVLRLSAGPQ
jgi:hypothetical protein